MRMQADCLLHAINSSLNYRPEVAYEIILNKTLAKHLYNTK